MAAYHITDTDRILPCSAKTKCKYGIPVDEHLPNKKTAELVVAQRKAAKLEKNAAERRLNKPLWSPPIEHDEPCMTQELFESLPHEKKLLAAAAYERLRYNEWDDEGRFWTTIYDNTYAGYAALKSDYETLPPEYALSREERERGERQREASSWVGGYDPQVEFAPVTLDSFDGDFLPLDKGVDHKIAQRGMVAPQLGSLSAAWIVKLEKDELSSVQWMTGAGTILTNKYLNLKKEFPNDYKERWLSHPDNRFNISAAQVEKRLRAFRSAMRKAPVLDEPVVIYRGTGAGETIEGSLSRPQSCSVSGAVGLGFIGTKNHESETPVLLEIKTRVLPTPVGVSHWEDSEMEVFAPLGKYRKIGEYDAMRWREGTATRRHAEENGETVRIIQLEYIG